MKRRDVLKGMAVAAGAATVGLPAVAGAKPPPCCKRDHDGDGNCDRHPVGKVQVFFSLVLPGPYHKLSAQLQEGIEGLEAQWLDMVVSQSVNVELFDKDGEPWLVSPAWKEGALCTDLRADPDSIFKDRQWHIVKWAVDYRRHHYWHDEIKPTLPPSPPSRTVPPRGEDRERIQCAWDAWLTWHKAQRERLGDVVVQFVGRVTPRPADVDVVEHAAKLGTPIFVNNRVKR